MLQKPRRQLSACRISDPAISRAQGARLREPFADSHQIQLRHERDQKYLPLVFALTKSPGDRPGLYTLRLGSGVYFLIVPVGSNCPAAMRTSLPSASLLEPSVPRFSPCFHLFVPCSRICGRPSSSSACAG